MTGLREKVAEAILPELSKQEMLLADPITLQRLMAKRCADAAIATVLQALKEPSEGMIAAAYEFREIGADLHDLEAHNCAPGIWTAMLTAFTRDHYLSALAEEDGKELG